MICQGFASIRPSVSSASAGSAIRLAGQVSGRVASTIAKPKNIAKCAIEDTYGVACMICTALLRQAPTSGFRSAAPAVAKFDVFL